VTWGGGRQLVWGQLVAYGSAPYLFWGIKEFRAEQRAK